MAKIEGIEVEKGVQSSVIIVLDNKIVFFDPYKIRDGEVKANIILITHDHFDHCDQEAVDSLKVEGTTVFGPQSCFDKIGNLKVLCPGDSVEEQGVTIKAVNSYNISKDFHPKGKYIGYVVTAKGKSVYFAGDTDRIPEMKQLGDIDIAFVPVGGTYTMNADEAADAINEDIKPKTAIPVHYGDVVGTADDAERFRSRCKCEVKII